MRYQNPEILYALLAIAVPIIIHLLNLRKHTNVYFSSIRFLKEIKEEQKKNLKLKNILILITRILAIIFLVITFAQPYILLNKNENIKRDVIIYVDNSFSMNAETKYGRALDVAKEKANIIAKHHSEKNIYLITNDLLTIREKSYQYHDVKQEINTLKNSHISRSISEIISYTKNISQQGHELYIISDMQASTIEMQNIKNIDTNTNITLIPVTHKTQNISIDTCWIQHPLTNITEEIHIYTQITNHAEKEDIENKVIFLYINGKQKTQQFINLKAKESKAFSFKFNITHEDIINGSITINDTPIDFDNTLYFNVKRNKKIDILCINEESENKAINALFNEDSLLFNLTNSYRSNLDYSMIARQDLIILNETETISSKLTESIIDKLNKNGGSILIIPPSNNIDVKKYNNFLSKLGLNNIKEVIQKDLRINTINIKHPIFNNVFNGEIRNINYPSSQQHNSINKNIPSTYLLQLENNNPFLSVYTKNKGLIYQLNSALNNKQNNLSTHALFVPLFINIAAQSITNKPLYHILNSENYFTSNYKNSGKDVLHLKDNNIDVIPEIKDIAGITYYNIPNIINMNGIYTLENNNKIVDQIAFNYNNKESSTKILSVQEINYLIEINNLQNINIIKPVSLSSFKTIISKNKTQQEYWKIALILSLLFFAIEIFIIKFFTT